MSRARRAHAVIRESRSLRARMRKQVRRELVHAAGCTWRGVHECAYRQELLALLIDARCLGVSVPRSLQRFIPLTAVARLESIEQRIAKLEQV